MSSNIPKIYGAIAKIKMEMEAIGKDQKNAKQGYRFRGIDDVYNGLQKLEAKHGVFSTPINIEPLCEQEVRSSGGGSGYRVKNLYTFRFFADDGSFFDAKAVGEAIDYGDKASNKAAAAAHKYANVQTYSIPTEGVDPDAYSHEIERKVDLKEIYIGTAEQNDWLTTWCKDNGITESQKKIIFKAIEGKNMGFIKTFIEGLKGPSQ